MLIKICLLFLVPLLVNVKFIIRFFSIEPKKIYIYIKMDNLYFMKLFIVSILFKIFNYLLSYFIKKRNKVKKKILLFFIIIIIVLEHYPF